jgi:FtsP/CotA-like multicopper oxidase with cupredoxin domain
VNRLDLAACGLVVAVLWHAPAEARNAPAPKSLGCPARPAIGSVVGEPEDLRSEHGELRVDLSYRTSVDSSGETHFCYVSADGSEAPTLRLQPGDLLVLRLKNEEPQSAHETMPPHVHSAAPACTNGTMSPTATNVHFHGLTVPPVCHQDDVLNTLIQPGDHPYEYRLRIPANEPPGLYWYHPHVHGMSKAQVLGGASGALIVEGVERANPALAGLAERVFIIRDRELVNPDAMPVQTDSMPAPMVMRDSEGDILNTGTGGGKPAKDLSVNFVPVPFPRYTPAVIQMRLGERQLWRILNASAITYLDLQVLIDDQLQGLGVVSLDGVPVGTDGSADRRIVWQSHALVPPGGRVEIVVKAPPPDRKASFVTRTVDTGPAGENDPTRPLATLVSAADAPWPHSHLAASPEPLPPAGLPWLGTVEPVRTRKLYFSEQPHDPKDPNSPTDFFITVEGQTPKLFDPAASTPDIVAHQGDVEDWVIENRTQELHAFHIHQLHFMLLDWNGIPLDEPFLRDTINVAYWDGKSSDYPRVRLRMDFRSPNVVGTFVYHCHLLEHEDGGMMGVIRVDPREPTAP